MITKVRLQPHLLLCRFLYLNCLNFDPKHIDINILPFHAAEKVQLFPSVILRHCGSRLFMVRGYRRTSSYPSLPPISCIHFPSMQVTESSLSLISHETREKVLTTGTVAGYYRSLPTYREPRPPILEWAPKQCFL